MMKPENLQDRFLNQARKDRTMLTLFLMNGFQLRGTIISFDQFAVLVLSLHCAVSAYREKSEGIFGIALFEAEKSWSHTDCKLVNLYTRELCGYKMSEFVGKDNQHKEQYADYY